MSKLLTGDKPSEFVTLETIIEITRIVLAQQPDNIKAKLFITWVDGLGHKPTDAEFQEWTNRVGIHLEKRYLQ